MFLQITDIWTQCGARRSQNMLGKVVMLIGTKMPTGNKSLRLSGHFQALLAVLEHLQMSLWATKTGCFMREDGPSPDIFCGNQTCRSTLKDRRSLGVLLATKISFLSQDYWTNSRHLLQQPKLVTRSRTISRHLLWRPKPVVLRGKMDNLEVFFWQPQPALFHEKSDHLQTCHVVTSLGVLLATKTVFFIAILLDHLRTSFAITKTGQPKSDHLQTCHVVNKAHCFTLEDRRLATKTVFLSQCY